MDQFIQTFLSWHLIIFCLSISAITFVLKKFANFAVTKIKIMKKFHDFWFQVLTPTIPVIIGGIMSYFMGSYPFPEEISTTSSRVFFGFVAGMFSGLVYKVIKSYISKKVFSEKDSQSE